MMRGMGLFDKRKKGGDDFDSPVEQIDLSAPPSDPQPVSAAPRAAAASSPEPSLPDRDDDPDEMEMAGPSYGIDDAIQLMRALPGDNVELVVQVVKRTLESTNVKVKRIIDDASRKQKNIEGRIDVLKKEIAEYEQEISTRKGEITSLEADHKETTMVKDRLQLAEKLGQAQSGSSGASKTTPGTPAPSTSASGRHGAAPAPRRPGGTIPPPASGVTSSSSSPTASGTASSGSSSTTQRQTTAKGTTIVAKK
jgi:hypothetical protein